MKQDPLYLETDAPGVGLGGELQQIRDGMNCPQEEAPHNSILRLTAFASKSLSPVEKKIQ